MAGLRVLSEGGNAADAAVAAAATLAVVEPTSTGIGGDCFALFYNADDQSVSSLNGSGRSPAALDLDVVEKCGGWERQGPHAVTVPGSIMGLARHRYPLRSDVAGRRAPTRNRAR